jgi:hypothetical protein
MCFVDINQELEKYSEKLETLNELADSIDDLSSKKDYEFAESLLNQFKVREGLSDNQWYWVGVLLGRACPEAISEDLGDMNPVWVMFRLAQANGGLKNPKIRLATESGLYIRLSFKTEKDNKRVIEVHQGGFSHHGRRLFIGWIRENKLTPYKPERVTDEMLELLKAFAKDPQKVAKASANIIGACGFCGHQLTDDASKHYGYGETCAHNYGLEYDKKNPKIKRSVHRV